MSRKTVRVDLPRSSPEGLIKLAEDIVKQHKKLGNKSPLDDDFVKQLESTNSEANTKKDEANGLHAQGEEVNQDADKLLGTAEGMTGENEGTVYALLLDAKDDLLHAFRGREQALESFGFNVVIGTSTPTGGGRQTDENE